MPAIPTIYSGFLQAGPYVYSPHAKIQEECYKIVVFGRRIILTKYEAITLANRILKEINNA